MELKEFIKRTITAIAESVEDLNSELEGKVIINPNVATQVNNMNANIHTVVEGGGFGGDKADKRVIIELKITAIENTNTIEFSIPIVIKPR